MNKSKVTSILQRVLLLGIEMGLQMAEQNIVINMAFVHDELWKQRRDKITSDAQKQIERIIAKDEN